MVRHPESYLEELIENGADRVTVHWEACRYPFRTLSMIKEFGISSGLAFNPKTTIPDLGFVLPVLDSINILSTEPQIKDSQFIPGMLRKILTLKENGELRNIELEIDGGLNTHNANLAAKMGVNTFVVGRSIFENGNISDNIRAIVNAISEK